MSNPLTITSLLLSVKRPSLDQFRFCCEKESRKAQIPWALRACIINSFLRSLREPPHGHRI